MSRPHDGQRTLFPFGNPFRKIVPKGSHASSKLLALLNTFEQTLSVNLKKLKPKDPSDILSLSWLTQAIAFLSETHSDVKTLITDLKFPVSDWDEKWVDIYLNSSMKILDICNALISELSRLDQSQLLIQYVLHILNSSGNPPSSDQLDRVRASLHDWTQPTTPSPKIENCALILEVLVGTLCITKMKNSSKGKVLMRALYGVKAVTIYICGILATTLSGCPKPLMEFCVCDEFVWAEAFDELRAHASTEIRRGKVTMLKELEAVEVCAQSLQVLVGEEHKGEREEFKECIFELGGRARVLANGLAALSNQVGDFFQIVLTGRDALLCNLTQEGYEDKCGL